MLLREGCDADAPVTAPQMFGRSADALPHCRPSPRTSAAMTTFKNSPFRSAKGLFRNLENPNFLKQLEKVWPFFLGYKAFDYSIWRYSRLF